MTNCLFCKIIAGDIPAKILMENEYALAFRDIHPQAPTHILIIPKKHIASIADLAIDDEALMGKLLLTAKTLAENEGIAIDGYRLVINCRENGGQTVSHIHFHLLGGRALKWPPG
jgi:histidine triad (HIT) family protein